MSDQWFMLTLVGKDQPGIVARVSEALFRGGCNLGEASMMRLGGNFTIMMMVRHGGSAGALRGLVDPVAAALGLTVHVDSIEGGLHRHDPPDVCITVYGADRAGIVAQVTGALAQAGLNITDLTSDVGGTEQEPIYVMQIEGHAGHGTEALERAVAAIGEAGVEVRLSLLDTLIG